MELRDFRRMNDGEHFVNSAIEAEDLGDNIWRGPGDQALWWDGISFLDESDREWIEISSDIVDLVEVQCL